MKIRPVEDTDMTSITVAKTAPHHMEHRWGARVELDIPVRLLWSNGPAVPARMRNASISGGLIELPESLPVYATLEVEMPGGRHCTPNMALAACVTRTGRGFIAVEWRDMGTPPLPELLRQCDSAHREFRHRNRVFR
jgi:hypothetical protein